MLSETTSLPAASASNLSRSCSWNGCSRFSSSTAISAWSSKSSRWPVERARLAPGCCPSSLVEGNSLDSRLEVIIIKVAYDRSVSELTRHSFRQAGKPTSASEVSIGRTQTLDTKSYHTCIVKVLISSANNVEARPLRREIRYAGPWTQLRFRTYRLTPDNHYSDSRHQLRITGFSHSHWLQTNMTGHEPSERNGSYFEYVSPEAPVPATPTGSAQRSSALSTRIISVLAVSYADLDIRSALETLDARGFENTQKARRNLVLDIQQEVIGCNGAIIKDFGQIAQVRAMGRGRIER